MPRYPLVTPLAFKTMPHLRVIMGVQPALLDSSVEPGARGWRLWLQTCLHRTSSLHCQKAMTSASVWTCQGPVPELPRQLQASHKRRGGLLPILAPHRVREARASSSGPSQPGLGSASADGIADVSADITPLFERPLQHRCSLEELVLWRESAAKRACRVGPTLRASEGGPTAEELLRELQWLLEDVAGREWAARVTLARPRVPLGASTMLVQATSRAAALAGSDNEASADLPTACHPPAHDAVVPSEPSRNAGELRSTVPLRADIAELERLWRRRLEERVPFQYLVACAHWRDMVLAVGEGVLIPRPETELLPDLALAAMRANPGLGGMPWADLGTGSGALAVGLVWALQEAARDMKGGDGEARVQVWAVDCSEAALSIAGRNVERLGMQQHVHLAKGNWLDALEGRGLEGRLGGILSNPPYIPSSRVPNLQAEVGEHEPWLALVGGGEDGMECLREICASAWQFLAPGGFLGLETDGGEQADAVAALLQEHQPDMVALGGAQASTGSDGGVQVQSTSSVLRCYERVEVVPDCFGVRRFVTAYRGTPPS